MQDALVDVSSAVNDFYFPNHLPWADTKLIAIQLLLLEYTQTMMIDLGDAYNPTIHIPIAMRNCDGIKSNSEIEASGVKIYFTDAVMHTKWKRFIDNNQTPQYYKSIYVNDVENIQNLDESVRFLLHCIDHKNIIHPFKPIEKRDISEVNSTLEDTSRTKKWRDTRPQADVDPHDSKKIPLGLPKGTKYNPKTQQPWRCQKHCTDSHTDDKCYSNEAKANATSVDQSPRSKIKISEQLTIAVRDKVKAAFPTIGSMPQDPPCRACIATELPDVIARAQTHGGTACGNFPFYNSAEAKVAREASALARIANRGGRGGARGGRSNNATPSANIAKAQLSDNTTSIYE